MWGAIIGDLAGSIYEYNQTKKISQVKCQKIIEDNAFFSDDTILTIAILEAVLTNKDYTYYLKKYGKAFLNYKPHFSPYFKSSFSPGFIKWLNGNYIGSSTGNGALMRISPICYLFENENDILINTLLATYPSHNSKEAIECTQKLATIIYYARKGLRKDLILQKLNITLNEKQFNKFNTTCYETLDNCIYAAFVSNTFEDAIRKILLYGGDTDTNACITGQIAEALYGIDNGLIEQAEKFLPQDFVMKLEYAYDKRKKCNDIKC